MTSHARPYWYRFTLAQWRAHVRGLTYGELVALRDALEATCASCARVLTTGARGAEDANTAKMAVVDAELGTRATAALRADLRDRR